VLDNEQESQITPKEIAPITKEDVSLGYSRLQESQEGDDEQLSKFYTDFYSLEEQDRYAVLHEQANEDSFINFLKQCSEANIKIEIQKQNEKLELIARNFKSAAQDSFRELTAVEQVDDERKKLAFERTTAHVDNLLNSLNIFSDEDKAKARETWGQAMVLDERGVEELTQSLDKYFQGQAQAVKDSFSDIENIQAEEEQFLAGIEIQRLMLGSLPTHSPAFVFRFPHNMGESAKEAGYKS